MLTQDVSLSAMPTISQKDPGPNSTEVAAVVEETPTITAIPKETHVSKKESESNPGSDGLAV